MPKRLILAALLTFLCVTYLKSAAAADCWMRDAEEAIPAPPGVRLKPDGYMCTDHLGVYAQAEDGELEVYVRAHSGRRIEWVMPRLQPRPLSRTADLLGAGLAYMAPVVDRATSSKTEIGGAP